MVNIDTVYQKVLAIANKEQRGYITPQEFNLFADHAQKEIFEQYFYDINQFGRMPGNNTEYSDMLNLLNEKIAIFKAQTVLTPSVLLSGSPIFKIPANIITKWHSLGTMLYQGIEAQQVSYNELLQVAKSPLLKPSKTLPVFYERSDGYIIKPDEITSGVICTYIRNPEKPNWSYQVVNEKPFFFNNDDSQNFELHVSEESELIYRILALAGIMLEKPQLTQSAITLEGAKVQQEKQ